MGKSGRIEESVDDAFFAPRTVPSVVMNEQSSEDQLRDRSRSPTHTRTKHSDRRLR